MSALLLLAVLATTAAAPPDIAEQASLEDCAIIAVVGRSELGWGSEASFYDFFPQYDLDGGGIYYESCPWRTMGVAPPPLGTRQSPRASSISRPRYDTFRTVAYVDVTVMVQAKLATDGQTMLPFKSVQSCGLRKRTDGWRIFRCEHRLIR